MYVYMLIGDRIKMLYSITLSEPILSKAASLVIRDRSITFNLPGALAKVLEEYNINPGDQVELLVFYFFLFF